MNKATTIVLNHIENSDFAIQILIQEMAISQPKSFNQIASLTGQNPSSFIRSILLKFASELLLKENQTIKEICYRVGFRSPAYFTKTLIKTLWNDTRTVSSRTSEKVKDAE